MIKRETKRETTFGGVLSTKTDPYSPHPPFGPHWFDPRSGLRLLHRPRQAEELSSWPGTSGRDRQNRDPKQLPLSGHVVFFFFCEARHQKENPRGKPAFLRVLKQDTHPCWTCKKLQNPSSNKKLPALFFVIGSMAIPATPHPQPSMDFRCYHKTKV